MKLKASSLKRWTKLPLAKLIKKKGRGINKIRNEKRDFTTDSTEIQRIMRDYYEQLYVNRMDKFLERCSLPRLIQEEI